KEGDGGREGNHENDGGKQQTRARRCRRTLHNPEVRADGLLRRPGALEVGTNRVRGARQLLGDFAQLLNKPAIPSLVGVRLRRTWWNRHRWRFLGGLVRARRRRRLLRSREGRSRSHPVSTR